MDIIMVYIMQIKRANMIQDFQESSLQKHQSYHVKLYSTAIFMLFWSCMEKQHFINASIYWRSCVIKGVRCYSSAPWRALKRVYLTHIFSVVQDLLSSWISIQQYVYRNPCYRVVWGPQAYISIEMSGPGLMGTSAKQWELIGPWDIRMWF